MGIDRQIRRRSRRAQALVELAIGMFAVSLVLSALFAFVHFITLAGGEQRTIRARAGKGALNGFGGEEAYSSAYGGGTIAVSALAADVIFGSSEVKVSEEVHIPVMTVPE